MEDNLKVRKSDFDALLMKLLQSPPVPLSKISPKKKRKPTNKPKSH